MQFLQQALKTPFPLFVSPCYLHKPPELGEQPDHRALQVRHVSNGCEGHHQSNLLVVTRKFWGHYVEGRGALRVADVDEVLVASVTQDVVDFRGQVVHADLMPAGKLEKIKANVLENVVVALQIQNQPY